MSYFWREEYNHFDETKHTILCVTLLIIGLDNYLNLPFGFSNETVFFSKSLVCSLLFEILVIIWLFSNKDDGIIFITFTILVPVKIISNFSWFLELFKDIMIITLIKSV